MSRILAYFNSMIIYNLSYSDNQISLQKPVDNSNSYSHFLYQIIIFKTKLLTSI